MSLSYIFDRLLIRFEKFVRWFKPNDEEIRPGIRKPTDLMVDEYAEGDGIDVAKEFFSARMLIDDPAYFDKHIQPCINRLLKELILSCLEDEEHPMWGYSTLHLLITLVLGLIPVNTR